MRAEEEEEEEDEGEAKEEEEEEEAVKERKEENKAGYTVTSRSLPAEERKRYLQTNGPIDKRKSPITESLCRY